MDLPQLPPEVLAEDRSPTVIGVVTMCLFITTTLLGLRLWTRACVVKQVGADDYATICAWLSVMGCGLAIVIMTRFGLGRHEQTCFWLSTVFYGLGHLAFKMSFLLQYYRVLVTHHMRKWYVAAMVVVLAWGLSVLVMSLAFCVPIQGFWDHSIPAKCFSQHVLYYLFGACSIATDIIIFLLPLPALFKLQLPRSQKLYLLGIFSLGFFIVAISVFRLQFLQIRPDFTYGNVTPALWSLGELSAAMFCLCLPPLKALATRMGLVEPTKTGASSNNRKSNLLGSPSTDITARTGEITQPNSPGEKPRNFGNFFTETELDQSERSTSSSLPPV
ncbi:Satratoxin biosynthesis SC1 cluster protein 4 [Colletotrichum trifolii]|uniref:Satratoxin biosynthesis SC1 cluster protein 4 n=1 Tax=Colletotrichum trifolii TaxID=5466 RepID=A0A4R8RRJ5_COLTR|nr:Satratoxin biosynthesis SC1 cluster protein 4 [Colletotrichum trifolii]